MKAKPNFSRITIIFCMLLLIIAISLKVNSKPSTDNSKLTLDNKSLNFLILSDWGREGINDTAKKAPGQIKVAKQLGKTAQKIKATFLVTCGDNFHGKGVPAVNDPLWKVNFENVFTDKSLMIPWYITLGNHDNAGNVEAELEYAKSSKRWIQPARYFSFEKTIDKTSNALFVILDSSPFIEEYQNENDDAHHIKNQNTNAQIKWCDSVLKSSKATWKFVFFHHPAYSASSKHGSTIEIQKLFVPIFENYHVDVCFSGHDHDLQHSKPTNSKIEYFGCGGGSETRKAGTADFTKFSQSSLGFGVVSLSKNKFKFSFVNELGKQIYNYEINK